MSIASFLPIYLRQRMGEALSGVEGSQLREASADLSQRYREERAGAFMTSDLHRLAYLSARMPATYAVSHTVLNHLSAVTAPESLLDLGAGPGGVMWAVASLWPDLKQITLVEQDPGLIRYGKFLSQEAPFSALQQAQWRQESLLQAPTFPPHDLVSMSYVLGELSADAQAHVVQKAWEATTQALVLIEPGTPLGFQCILKAREGLIQQGGTIFAPCPHNLQCPLQGDNWCHFSVRLLRESFHRQAKGGSLPYEDEKYAYIIARKPPEFQETARIITKPRLRTGQVILDLCTPEGLKRTTVSKKNPHYAKARKLEWGEGW